MSEIRRAIVKSYDAAAHKAAVQIAGSLAVWLDAVRVATNIPPADVVTGRQCTVLFLDPSNQDDAVIIAIQGALPSVGEILIATATSDLTLTTSAQSITGDGDSSKVRILLPTPGDWLIEATSDFLVDTAGTGGLIAELFVNDSGSPESSKCILDASAAGDGGTVSQRWKVTTTAADTPVELKAQKAIAAGVARIFATHTRLTATGVKRSTGGGGVTDHGALTGLSDDDHTQYGHLAQAETWAALQTFSAGIRLATGATGAIEDSGGTNRIELYTASPNVALWGDVLITGHPGVGTVPSTSRALDVIMSATLFTADLIKGSIAVTTPFSGGTVTALNIAGGLVLGVGHIASSFSGLFFDAGVNAGTGGAGVTNVASIKTRLQHTNLTATITAERGLHLLSPQIAGGTPVFTTMYGIDVENYGNHTGMIDVYGVKIADTTLNTGFSHLLAVGPATPYLRVVGRAPPDAALTTEGDSNLYLAWMENGTVTLRQVRWRQQSSLGATDKVLIAA